MLTLSLKIYFKQGSYMRYPGRCPNGCLADAKNALTEAPTDRCLTDGQIHKLTDTLADTPTDAPTVTLTDDLIDALPDAPTDAILTP